MIGPRDLIKMIEDLGFEAALETSLQVNIDSVIQQQELERL